ncbi:glycosyl transferase family 2 [Colwellia sp. PAMC 20917]|uniref:glycosyltransferase family 2 protein n=1 Tax=Colwellia sp. PAMC 20917 TaxID=1816218 RepID=UPI0008783A3F|nr:glycosyltransferase [Colwellia sp. PAMC 20917]AOW77058.1 glycosyl transferase family 2 [Colwellia sp. PAMC 20917]
MSIQKTQVTIAIITCRRPLWLQRLLKSLIKQKVSDDIELNILVVDNAGEESTVDVVNQIAKKSKYSIHYFHESSAGIVFARNRCVEEFLKTDSQNLFFIDDDEWPESDQWAQKLLDKKAEYKADVVTSHVISVGGEDTPSWAIDLIYGKNNLVEGDSVNVFYTNNLLLSRKVLEQVNPAFDERFAMTGASDYHFALKCQKAGFNAFYTNAPVLEEFPKSRATVKWFLKRGFRSGIGFTRSHLFEDSLIKTVFYCAAMSAIRLLRGIGYCILGIITLNKTTFVDGLFRLCSAIGTIAGFFGIKHNEYNTIHGQ